MLDDATEYTHLENRSHSPQYQLPTSPIVKGIGCSAILTALGAATSVACSATGSAILKAVTKVDAYNNVHDIAKAAALGGLIVAAPFAMLQSAFTLINTHSTLKIKAGALVLIFTIIAGGGALGAYISDHDINPLQSGLASATGGGVLGACAAVVYTCYKNH